MGFPFAQHASERGNGALERVPIESLDLKTERFALAIRLFLGCAFTEAESSKTGNTVVPEISGALIHINAFTQTK